MAKRSTTPAPIDPDELQPIQLTDEAIEVGTFVCNWDYTDPQFARLLFLADVPCETKGDDLIGTEIDCMFWICQKIEIPDRQNGGKCKVVKSVLIGPNDEILNTLSHGVLRSVQRMRETFGKEPYVPAIPMTVKGASTGTGSDMLMLIPKSLTASK